MGGHDDHHGHAKPSVSEEEIRKLLARAETQTFSEAPKYTADVCTGVPQAVLAGRFENERARLGPDFTEADRQWRIKYLASQNLHPSEPFEVPRRKLNPFRRFYRYPLNLFEDYLTKYMVCFDKIFVYPFAQLSNFGFSLELDRYDPRLKLLGNWSVVPSWATCSLLPVGTTWTTMLLLGKLVVVFEFITLKKWFFRAIFATQCPILELSHGSTTIGLSMSAKCFLIMASSSISHDMCMLMILYFMIIIKVSRFSHLQYVFAQKVFHVKLIYYFSI